MKLRFEVDREEAPKPRSITFRELIEALERARPQAEVLFDSGDWDDCVLAVGTGDHGKYSAILKIDPPATVTDVLGDCQYFGEDKELPNMPVWVLKWAAHRTRHPAIVEVVDGDNKVILKTAFL
jgi:hypothetical protein